MAGPSAPTPSYEFPGYPTGCPPAECGESCGTYFRLLTNANRDDPEHYLTYHDRRVGHDPDSCESRALSVVLTEAQARGYQASLGPQYRFIGKFDLTGGHGLVRIGNRQTGHCSWWVAGGVRPALYCSSVGEIRQ